MKALVSLSGGLDSTVLLATVLKEFSPAEVLGVSFFYGSKHNPHENMAAVNIANHYAVEFRLLDLSKVMQGFTSALLADNPQPIPEGHYQAESMRQTVVPARNLIFLSTLTGLAWSLKAGLIYIGVHAGDHVIYPDCRPDFIQAMSQAIRFGSDDAVQLRAPFLHIDKAEIVKRGLALKVPFQFTRTCYTSDEVACGRCGSCRERLESFQLNGATDPIPYQS